MSSHITSTYQTKRQSNLKTNPSTSSKTNLEELALTYAKRNPCLSSRSNNNESFNNQSLKDSSKNESLININLAALNFNLWSQQQIPKPNKKLNAHNRGEKSCDTVDFEKIFSHKRSDTYNQISQSNCRGFYHTANFQLPEEAINEDANEYSAIKNKYVEKNNSGRCYTETDLSNVMDFNKSSSNILLKNKNSSNNDKSRSLNTDNLYKMSVEGKSISNRTFSFKRDMHTGNNITEAYNEDVNFNTPIKTVPENLDSESGAENSRNNSILFSYLKNRKISRMSINPFTSILIDNHNETFCHTNRLNTKLNLAENNIKKYSLTVKKTRNKNHNKSVSIFDFGKLSRKNNDFIKKSNYPRCSSKPKFKKTFSNDSISILTKKLINSNNIEPTLIKPEVLNSNSIKNSNKRQVSMINYESDKGIEDSRKEEEKLDNTKFIRKTSPEIKDSNEHISSADSSKNKIVNISNSNNEINNISNNNIIDINKSSNNFNDISNNEIIELNKEQNLVLRSSPKSIKDICINNNTTDYEEFKITNLDQAFYKKNAENISREHSSFYKNDNSNSPYDQLHLTKKFTSGKSLFKCKKGKINYYDNNTNLNLTQMDISEINKEEGLNNSFFFNNMLIKNNNSLVNSIAFTSTKKLNYNRTYNNSNTKENNLLNNDSLKVAKDKINFKLSSCYNLPSQLFDKLEFNIDIKQTPSSKVFSNSHKRIIVSKFVQDYYSPKLNTEIRILESSSIDNDREIKTYDALNNLISPQLNKSFLTVKNFYLNSSWIFEEIINFSDVDSLEYCTNKLEKLHTEMLRLGVKQSIASKNLSSYSKGKSSILNNTITNLKELNITEIIELVNLFESEELFDIFEGSKTYCEPSNLKTNLKYTLFLLVSLIGLYVLMSINNETKKMSKHTKFLQSSYFNIKEGFLIIDSIFSHIILISNLKEFNKENNSKNLIDAIKNINSNQGTCNSKTCEYIFSTCNCLQCKSDKKQTKKGATRSKSINELNFLTNIDQDQFKVYSIREKYLKFGNNNLQENIKSETTNLRQISTRSISSKLNIDNLSTIREGAVKEENNTLNENSRSLLSLNNLKSMLLSKSCVAKYSFKKYFSIQNDFCNSSFAMNKSKYTLSEPINLNSRNQSLTDFIIFHNKKIYHLMNQIIKSIKNDRKECFDKTVINGINCILYYLNNYEVEGIVEYKEIIIDMLFSKTLKFNIQDLQMNIKNYVNNKNSNNDEKNNVNNETKYEQISYIKLVIENPDVGIVQSKMSFKGMNIKEDDKPEQRDNNKKESPKKDIISIEYSNIHNNNGNNNDLKPENIEVKHNKDTPQENNYNRHNNISSNSLNNFSFEINLENVEILEINDNYLNYLPLKTKNTSKKLTLVIELEDNLVHLVNNNSELLIEHRPYLNEFLNNLTNYYELVLVSLSKTKEVSDKIFSLIDIDNKVIDYKLYKYSSPDSKEKEIKVSFIIVLLII